MSTLLAERSYLAVGANRHPSAADWDVLSGLLAFGTDRNVAIWQPQAGEDTPPALIDILSGHTDTVNAVKFIPESNGTLITGSVDRTLRIWKKDSSIGRYACMQTLSDHQNSINCIAVNDRSKLFASGAADSTVKIWLLGEDGVAKLQQSITITPRFFPLALALSPLAAVEGAYVLAVAGTKDIIQLYVLDPNTSPDFKLQATLSGHEGWIRSLEFTTESFAADSDLILASASQDKYIRLWRIHQGTELAAAGAPQDPTLGAFLPGKSLSNKAHRFHAKGLDFVATFEALLLGHEDWIYSTKWRAVGNQLQLLSASADNSLAIWQPDETTGVWVTIARLGEISAEKGSTTATGSTGGFWAGLWSPSGETVVCLGRTGSWRLWDHDVVEDRWVQNIGISGHIQSVTGISWSKNGDYLLSTSSDQTTRLHAKWKHDDQATWHEMARPQIHGYDLNCIDSLGTSRFVSGADEKLLRVFDEPKSVAKLLSKLCGVSASQQIEEMPDAANMPVLGLSNKAVQDGDNAAEDATILPGGVADAASHSHLPNLDLNHPPLEDHLSRHTLWPEVEKLYGHGYEISNLATSHDGSLIATACRASSIDHAVIRLFETKTWLEIKPPLTAHSSTITRLRFSADDNLLLSVGRDRQWAIFGREGDTSHTYKLVEQNPKGHTRMILDAAWAPTKVPVFATAGRDKQVKIWAQDESTKQFVNKATIAQDSPVTAIDIADVTIGGAIRLAIGTEAGKVSIYDVDIGNGFTVEQKEVEYPSNYPYPSKSVTQLAWKPSKGSSGVQRDGFELAIASEDSSLRVYSFGGLSSGP